MTQLINIIRVRATMIHAVTTHTAFRSFCHQQLNRTRLFQTNEPTDQMQTGQQNQKIKEFRSNNESQQRHDTIKRSECIADTKQQRRSR